MAAPHYLDPDNQPLLFAFVRELTSRAGLPEPAKIGVDWNVNCSCVFAGGLGLFSRPDFELVIGLPLAAKLRLNEFAGILAHELSHAAQITAARSSRGIWTVHSWLSRAALESDAFDESINERLGTASGTKKLLLRCIEVAAVPGRGAARLMLLALAGAGAVFFRGMEREADRCQVRVAGTENFISTILELNLLSLAAQRAVVELSRIWRGNSLVDNYPGLVVYLRGGYSDAFIQRLQAGMQAGRTGMFSLHPCDRDRVALVRSEAKPGALSHGLAATTLFADFEALCREVTFEYYDQELSLNREGCRVIPFQHVLERQESGAARRNRWPL